MHGISDLLMINFPFSCALTDGAGFPFPRENKPVRVNAVT